MSLELLISSFTLSNSFSTLFSKTNSSWLIFKSVKATQIKISMLFSLDFANHSIYHVSVSFSWRRPKLSQHIKPNHTNIALSMKEATQKYRKLTDCWTKCCYLSLPFSMLTATCTSFTFFKGRVSSVLGQSTPPI